MIRLKLRDILKERNISQKKLAKMTGISVSTICEIVSDRRTGYNKKHLSNIIETLHITDMNDLFYIE